MKNYKIIGAGGTGKTTKIKNFLSKRNDNYLILSFTHSGKMNFINEKINTEKAKTIHSFIHYILYKTRINLKYRKLFAHLNPNTRKLFELFSYLYDFERSLKQSYKILDEMLKINSDIYKLIRLLYLKEKQENLFYNKLKRLKTKEKIFLILFIEPNLFDDGYIINPFTKQKIMSKEEFIIFKYNTILGEDLTILKDIKEFLLSQKVFIPLNITYLYKMLNEEASYLKEYLVAPQYDYIIFEEAQDIPCVVYNFIKEYEISKRIIMIGDPYQAIYIDLGYNSYFMNDEIFYKKRVLKEIWRYSNEYLLFIKTQFKVIPEVLKKAVSKCDINTQYLVEDLKKVYNYPLSKEMKLVANNTINKKLKEVTNKKNIQLISTHSSKGLTFDKMAFCENKGKYYLLIKNNEKLKFIEEMLRYVGLTRVRRKIIFFRRW